MSIDIISTPAPQTNVQPDDDLFADGLEELFFIDEDHFWFLPEDFSTFPTGEVRRLCEAAFRELNNDYPRTGASDAYHVLAEELQARDNNQN